VYREPARAADLVERALKRYRLGGEALREGLPDAPRASINYGAGGIAYALLRIAQRRQDARRLALADLWSQKAYALATSDDAFYSAALQIDRNSVGERSLFHSAAGLHCVRALVSAAQRDGVTANRALRAFVQHSLGPNDSVDRASRLDAVIGRGEPSARVLRADRDDPGIAGIRPGGHSCAGRRACHRGSWLSRVQHDRILGTLGGRWASRTAGAD